MLRWPSLTLGLVLHANAFVVRQNPKWRPHASPLLSCTRSSVLKASFLEAAVGAYDRSLVEHYLPTTMVQAFTLVGAGDFFAQMIECQSHKQQMVEEDGCDIVDDEVYCVTSAGLFEKAPVQSFDATRFFRMALLGTVIGGLGTATWLKYLESLLPGNDDPIKILEKATLDACIWAPIANTAYLVLTPLLEGRSTDQIKQMLDERFFAVMKTELMTFFPYNLVSFSLVPPLLRPFTTGFVSCCFAVYLSWTTHLGVGGGGGEPEGGPRKPPADVEEEARLEWQQQQQQQPEEEKLAQRLP